MTTPETLTIHYPDGDETEVFAVFQGLYCKGLAGGERETDGTEGLGIAEFIVCMEMQENISFHGTMLHPGEVLAIDPRCVVLNRQGRVVYGPIREKLSADLQQWMDENPEWPRSLKAKLAARARNLLKGVDHG